MEPEPEHATIARDATPALRSLAKWTGRTLTEVRNAAEAGTLIHLVAKPGELQRRRRARLDQRRYTETR